MSSCCPGERGCGGGGCGEVKDRGGRGEERREESGIPVSGHRGGGRRWVGGVLVSAGVALTGCQCSYELALLFVASECGVRQSGELAS